MSVFQTAHVGYKNQGMGLVPVFSYNKEIKQKGKTFSYFWDDLNQWKSLEILRWWVANVLKE
jgi:hypothetical protein